MRWKFWKREPASLGAVQADLDSNSPTIVSRGLQAVLKNPHLFRACQPKIELLFTHRIQHIRWFAAKVAARLGDESVGDTLVTKLLREDAVSSTTASILEHLGGRAVPSLKRYLWHDSVRENPKAIRRALQALVEIDENPVQTLFALLSAHTKQFVVEQVAIFGAEAMPILLAGYRDDARGEADVVVEILGKLGDLGFHTLIDLLLENPPPAKRKLIIAALWKRTGSFFDRSFFDGWRSPDESLDLLVALAMDTDRETTLVAAWLIRELLPFASEAKREQIESATSFLLMGEIEARLRTALEKCLRPQRPNELMWLAA